ncbi:unnamed protein product [Phytomonas sp. EM1]|nr:unnamed protein product [Phytomonas sp. EM1]|eukprot:CCW60011.1 unnamed protein product [Phytomonas sp. isolate EM1]
MRRLSHGHFLKLSVRFFFTLRRFEDITLCRFPQGSCRYTHTQSTGQLTDEEEEELVRYLVQDAFYPSNAAGKCSGSQSQPMVMCQKDISSADPTLSVNGNRNELKATATDGCSPSPDALSAEETDSRAMNKPYEKFARVRLSSHAYTVEELSKINNREANIEWMCMHCQTYNFMGRRSCRHCGVSELSSHRERHPPTRYVVSFPTSWICEGCGHQNNASDANGSSSTRASVSPIDALSRSTVKKHRTKFFCAQCSKPFGGVREWYCPYCAHINSKASTQCSTCLAERPVLWKCGECEYAFNSIFSTVCFNCKQRRLMKASNSTVACLSCGIRNDCRWELCEACMSPLPAMIETVEKKDFDQQAARVTRGTTPRNMGPVAASVQRRASEAQAGKIKNPLQESNTTDPPPSASVATSHRPPPTSAETSGAWWCTQCNIIQRRNAVFCDVCLRPRHLAEEITAPSDVKNGHTSEREGCDKGNHSTRDSLKLPPMGSWQCPYCRQFRDAKELRCCGKIREIRKDYWLCKMCSSVNRKDREVCIGCSMPPALAEEHWACVVCEFENTKDSLLCERCGAAHASLWRCISCRLAVPQSQGICPTCRAAKPDVPAPIVCLVCQAPNAPARMACFRCRARLRLSWQCTRCQATHADRTLLRCPTCLAPHLYNEAEETWVCELCASAIASGGDLPVRQQCPKCRADRLPECLSFPSRWRCKRCEIFNRTANPQCVECGSARCMPETFHLTVTCPQCFGQTEANTKETCTNCGCSLSEMLTLAASDVHVSPALIQSSFSSTNPHASPDHHQMPELSVDAAPPPCEHVTFPKTPNQANSDDEISLEDEVSAYTSEHP